MTKILSNCPGMVRMRRKPPAVHFVAVGHLTPGHFLFIPKNTKIMNDLKNLQPRFLETNKHGELFAPLYIKSYDHLGSLMTNLITSIELLAEHEENTGHRPKGETGLAIGGIATILSELSGLFLEDMHLLDKLRELKK